MGKRDVKLFCRKCGGKTFNAQAKNYPAGSNADAVLLKCTSCGNKILLLPYQKGISVAVMWGGERLEKLAEW